MSFAPRDALRLSLFRAEVAAGADERALAVLQPLLNDNRGYGYGHRYRASNMSSPENEAAADEADPDMGADSVETDSQEQLPVTIPATISSLGEKLAFSLEVAKVQERLRHDGEAENWLLAATMLTDDAGQKAELRKRLAAAREQVRVSAKNSTRRPVVQESIDQTVLVRPRIGAVAIGGRP